MMIANTVNKNANLLHTPSLPDSQFHFKYRWAKPKKVCRSTPDFLAIKQHKLDVRNNTAWDTRPYGLSAYQVLMYQTHGNGSLNAPCAPRAISSTALPAHVFTLTNSILTLKNPRVKRICQSGEISMTNLSKTYRKRQAFLPACADIFTFRYAQGSRSSPRPAQRW